MELYFKRGFVYTRKSIGDICYPGQGITAGGNWYTGYTPFENNLIIFMNIGVPGRTGHDFDNHFDEKNNTIVWFGKPNAHSGQPIFRRLINGETTPHFFARWDSGKPEFVYLGVGSIVKYEDGVNTREGNTIKLTLTCEDYKDIINSSLSDEDIILPSSSFALEKHLEDYICKNWDTTVFGRDYNIFENGRQFPTDSGPLDILALRNDEKEFLVLELKREKAGASVIGQTLKYMGYIKSNLATKEENVRGCIIATEEDKGLKNALLVTPNIDFYRYKLDFSLDKIASNA